jgi:mannose-6-phosphate isomerase-like protein (cupin superfamily)
MTPQEPIDTQHSWLTLINRHTSERLLLRRILREGEMCLEVKGTLPPNQDGPPLHIHFTEDEEGTVIAGTLAAEVDGVQVRIEQGGLVRLPRGSAHRWWNGGTETLRLEGFVRPAVDLDRFLSAIFDVLNSGPARRPPVFYMAHLLWRHRQTQTVLIAPRWIQAVLFPTIVLVGTLLGRYRGTDWPGCPDRFPAASLFTQQPARGLQAFSPAYMSSGLLCIDAEDVV